MGKIIEFVGANGVGKSATYNTLVTLWSTNMCWIPCEKVKFVEKGNSKIEDLVVKFKSFTGKKGIELITFSQKNKAIQNFEYDNKEYVDFELVRLEEIQENKKNEN
jgi:ABC-type multidrug transport system ATPase subunit